MIWSDLTIELALKLSPNPIHRHVYLYVLEIIGLLLPQGKNCRGYVQQITYLQNCVL